jgi:hypothetical protein
MGKPDALSRWADHRSRQGDNDNLTLLAPELFQIHMLAGERLQGDKLNILRKVQHSLRDDMQEESVAKEARGLQNDKGRGTVKVQSGLRVMGYSCFTVRSMSSKTKN